MGARPNPAMIGDIPIPQLNENDLRTSAPGPPPQVSEIGAGYMGKTGKIAAISSGLLRGWLEGQRMKEARIAQQANREVAQIGSAYEHSRESYVEFAQRKEVQDAAKKYADWIKETSAQGPHGGSVQMPDAKGNLQSPLNATEEQLLNELGRRKNSAEQAKQFYASTLEKYLIPEQGAKKPKEKGARGIPIIGNILQALNPNLTPEIATQRMVQMVREDAMDVPDVSTEEKYQRARLAEFERGAPLRQKEEEARGRELETKGKIEDLQGQLAEAVKKGDRQAEERVYGQIQALKGQRVPATEKLGEEMASIGLAVLAKTRQGLNPQANPDQFSDDEKAWYQRTLQYRPNNLEAAILEKVGTTKNGRTYTMDDAVNEIVQANARIYGERRQPSVFAQQLEYYRDAEAFSQFRKGFAQLTPEQKGMVDMEVRKTMRSTPEEREEAKTNTQERVSAALNEAMTKDPDRFKRFIKGTMTNIRATQKPGEKKPTTTGDVLYTFQPSAPAAGTLGFGVEDKNKVDADRKEFLGIAVERMRSVYKLTDAQIASALGMTVQQLTQALGTTAKSTGQVGSGSGYPTGGAGAAPPQVNAPPVARQNPYRQNP